MIVQDVIVAALLALAAVCGIISGIGVLRSKNNYAALHCSAASAVLAPLLALIAVIVRIPAGQSTIEMALVALVLLAGAPITSHAIAVAEYRRRSR